jgi:hypothetical protein
MLQYTIFEKIGWITCYSPSLHCRHAAPTGYACWFKMRKLRMRGRRGLPGRWRNAVWADHPISVTSIFTRRLPELDHCLPKAVPSHS